MVRSEKKNDWARWLLGALLIGLLAYGWWRSQRRAQMRSHTDAARQGATRPLAAPPDMVACAHCALHVPRAEALAHGANHYCCTEHRPPHAG